METKMSKNCINKIRIKIRIVIVKKENHLFSLISVLNNIFNLLMTINAASNFILYCLLSDKYRKTVKTLFCDVRLMRRNTLSSSRSISGRTTSSFYSRSRNSNVFNMPIYKQRSPQFSISKEEYANLQAETAKRNRFSLSTLTSPSQNNSTVSNPVLCPLYSSFVFRMRMMAEYSHFITFEGNRE